MDLRRRVFFVLVLLLGGFGVGILLRPFLWRTDAEWRERVREDTLRLAVLVRPTPWLDAPEGTLEHEEWLARRRDYPAEHLAALRERLHAYVDLYVAEYADAAVIYDTGSRPEVLSEGAKEARARFRELFGAAGEKGVAEFDAKREDAYRASPVIGGGADPSLVDYREEWRRLREWEPLVRRRIEELTASP